MDAQWWLIWLGVALVAGVAEIFTLGLVFAMVAGGALVAAAVAGVTGSWILSVLAFAASTGLLLLVVRPPLLQYARRSLPPAGIGIEALVGRRAEVLSVVTRRGGQVKLAGEVWSARTETAGDSLEIGSIVFVSRIDGATAVVEAFPPDRAALTDPAEQGRPAIPPHPAAHEGGADPHHDPTHPSDRPET